MKSLLLSGAAGAAISALSWSAKRFCSKTQQKRTSFISNKVGYPITSTKGFLGGTVNHNTVNAVIPSLITLAMGTTPAGIITSASTSVAIMLDDYLRSRDGIHHGKGIVGSIGSLFSGSSATQGN